VRGAEVFVADGQLWFAGGVLLEVKLGGFSRAAEKVQMTQPAVSPRIGQMEQA
jgi:Bacterial regulatory helix-turn-helix protein, lysR family